MNAIAKQTRALVSCSECGAEAQLLDGHSDVDLDQAVAEWTVEHEKCGQPAGLTNWQYLVEAGKCQTLVQHDGDLEKVMPFPRPLWADPDRDQIGTSLPGSCYRSAIASVPATHARGWLDDDWVTARVDVATKQYGNGFAMVGLTLAKPATAGADVGLSLTPDEATQLADVLRAAADLATT